MEEEKETGTGETERRRDRGGERQEQNSEEGREAGAGGERERGAGGQVGRWGRWGSEERPEVSCVLTQFHMQVCLLASLGLPYAVSRTGKNWTIL